MSDDLGIPKTFFIRICDGFLCVSCVSLTSKLSVNVVYFSANFILLHSRTRLMIIFIHQQHNVVENKTKIFTTVTGL